MLLEEDELSFPSPIIPESLLWVDEVEVEEEEELPSLKFAGNFGLSVIRSSSSSFLVVEDFFSADLVCKCFVL